MANKKYQGNYKNVYMSEMVQGQAQRVAEMLTLRGAMGLLDEEGRVQVSALFRHLLKRVESELIKPS